MKNEVACCESIDENWGVCENNWAVTGNDTELREIGNNTSSETSFRLQVLHHEECGRDISKSKYYGYIYETTNLVNGKKYIGQHSKSSFDTKYLGSGKLLVMAIRKYGREHFECSVLEWCYSREDINKKEILWIEQKDAVNSANFYNIGHGGEGFNPEDVQGEKNPRYGISLSTETREKISKSLLGRTASEETKKKLSVARSGKNHYMYGKKYSNDMRKLFSDAHKGICHTEETKKKMSRTHKVKGIPREVIEKGIIANRKKILCVETGKVFCGIKSVLRYLGLSCDGSNLAKCARGVRKTFFGFHWKYL